MQNQPIDLRGLAFLVKSMREAQKGFFMARRSQDNLAAQRFLGQSKALERKVDLELEAILNPKLL